MKLFKQTALVLSLIPSLALADFCDILAGNGAPECRIKATKMGGAIVGNWIRTKPELASQPSQGKKGYFVSGMTPVFGTLGVPHNGNFKLGISCFSGERSMDIEALPYMLGLANGANKSFNLTFKVDNKPPFTEKWPLDLKRGQLQAPKGSQLATALQGAHNLVVTTDGILGRKETIGYVYKIDGFDQINASICKS